MSQTPGKKLDKDGQPSQKQTNCGTNELSQQGCPSLSRFNESLPKYETVKNISHRFSLDREAVRMILGISESTQFRYEKNNPILKPTLADRLERFQRIIQQAVELFEDEAEAKRWLSTPKKSLGDLSPWQALATDAGAKKVENLLTRAEYGIFG